VGVKGGSDGMQWGFNILQQSGPYMIHMVAAFLYLAAAKAQKGVLDVEG